MKFLSLEDAQNHFFKYEELKEKVPDYISSVENLPKMGEWILFRHIENSKKISKPILGLVVGWTTWDMALVLEYVKEWRAWEVNSKILHYDHYLSIASFGQEVQKIALWMDDIKVLGHWKTKPSFSQLKQSLKNEIR